jgi:hypothetical protein
MIYTLSNQGAFKPLTLAENFRSISLSLWKRAGVRAYLFDYA